MISIGSIVKWIIDRRVSGKKAGALPHRYLLAVLPERQVAEVLNGSMSDSRRRFLRQSVLKHEAWRNVK
jgi:hypothetical protein